MSCKKNKEPLDENLCSKASPYIGNELKIEGYYYEDFVSSGTRMIIFLYENGVVLHGGTLDLDEIPHYETLYSNGQYYDLVKNDKIDWGVFHISGTNIAYEKWYPSTNQLITFVREGEIINDSTFHISRAHRCDGSDNSNKDEIYHFKKFDSKPDSTNSFTN